MLSNFIGQSLNGPTGGCAALFRRRISPVSAAAAMRAAAALRTHLAFAPILQMHRQDLKLGIACMQKERLSLLNKLKDSGETPEPMCWFALRKRISLNANWGLTL